MDQDKSLEELHNLFPLHQRKCQLGRERERNEGGVSKREKIVKTWIKRVATVIVVI